MDLRSSVFAIFTAVQCAVHASIQPFRLPNEFTRQIAVDDQSESLECVESVCIGYERSVENWTDSK